MQKGAPRTGHQKRRNRVALLCKRAQLAPKPGGSPLAWSEDAAFILKTTVATKIDLENASAVRKVVQACVGTKFVAKGGDLAYNIATDAVKTVALTSGDKKEINIKSYAKGEKSPSGMMEDSTLLKGIMFNKVVNHPKTKMRIENHRILLLDCNIEYKKGESQTNIKIMKKDDLTKTLELEEAYSKKICDEITTFRLGLVIMEKGVSDLAQPFFTRSASRRSAG